MNKSYRTLWNEATQTYVAVAENVKSHGKKSGSLKVVSSAVAAALLTLGTGQAMATIGGGCSGSDVTTSITSTCSISGTDSVTISGTGSIAVSGGVALSVAGAGSIVIAEHGNVSNTAGGVSAIFANNATQTGYIDNAGTISSSQSYGIEYVNSRLGGIRNRVTGQIISTNNNGYAVDLNNGTTLTGGISNAGLIQAPLYGLALRGVSMTVGDVVNETGGTISATGNGMGLFIDNGSTVHSVQNNGVITGGNIGEYFGTNYRVTNGVTNSGTIMGGVYGLVMDGGTLSGGITNSGSIIGATSIYASDSAIFNGTLINKVGGRIVSTASNGYAVSRPSGANPIISVENQGTGDTSLGIMIGAVNGQMNFTNNGSWSNQQGNASGDVVAGTRRASTITGNYVQNSSGAMVVGAAGTGNGQYSKLVVGGTASIAGRIHVDVASAFDNVTNSGAILSNVVTAAGGLTTGTLQVTDNSVLLGFGVQTTANTLSLCMTTQNNTCGSGTSDALFDPYPAAPAASSTAVLASVLRTGNTAGFGVAGSLDQLLTSLVSNGTTGNLDMDAALNAFLGQSATDQQISDAIMDMLPILIGAVPQSSVNALHSMNKIIQSRVESVQGLNSGDETADQFGWARVFGNWGDQNDHRGVPGFESRTQGLALGIDKPITDRIRAGSLFTYARSNMKSNVGNSNVDVDTYEVAGYGSYNIDPQTDINFQLDVGVNKAESTRHIAFTGTTARVDFDSFNWHLSGGIGRLFQISENTNITPAVRVDYTHVKTEGYTEKGAGPLNLRVNGSNFEELLLTADVKLSHKLTDDGLKFVANGSAGYDFINEQAQTTSTFTGGGPSFVSRGLEVSPWVYRGGLGLVKETGNGTEFSARYDAEGRTSGYINQTASVKVRWAF